MAITTAVSTPAQAPHFSKGFNYRFIWWWFLVSSILVRAFCAGLYATNDNADDLGFAAGDMGHRLLLLEVGPWVSNCP